MEELVKVFVDGVLTNGVATDITLLDVLHSAGFVEADTISVATHKVEEMESQQDCIEGTGKFYPVNMNSRLVVLRQSEVLELATRWLDGIYLYINQHRKDDLGNLEKTVTEFIERSRPLEPIVLTEFGERLRESSNMGAGIYATHTRDDDPISCFSHDFCNSYMDTKKVSASHNALVCSGCGLRVVYPNAIKTYGQLREHLVDLQPADN